MNVRNYCNISWCVTIFGFVNGLWLICYKWKIGGKWNKLRLLSYEANNKWKYCKPGIMAESRRHGKASFISGFQLFFSEYPLGDTGSVWQGNCFCSSWKARRWDERWAMIGSCCKLRFLGSYLKLLPPCLPKNRNISLMEISNFYETTYKKILA